MKNEDFYAMTFFATSDTIQCEKRVQERKMAGTIIPTPREISTSCGFAIRFLAGRDLSESRLLEFQQELSVNSDLYYLGQKEKDGKRSVKLLYSHRVS